MSNKFIKSVQAFFADDDEPSNKKANTENVHLERDDTQASLNWYLQVYPSANPEKIRERIRKFRA